MPRYRLLFLGFAAYLVFMLVLFPATVAWSLFAPKNLPLQLQGLSGTIWQGNSNQARWKGQPLGTLHWDLHLLPLFLGELGARFSLQTQQGYLQGEVKTPLGFAAVNLAELKGQMPVAELLRYAPQMPIPVAVSGTVSLDITQLELDIANKSTSASGRINWHSAGVLSPQAFEMGNLQADIATDEKGVVTALLKDLGGPLKLDARAKLKPDHSYVLSGNVAAARDAEASLEQALAWLGKADSSGRYRLALSGKL